MSSKGLSIVYEKIIHAAGMLVFKNMYNDGDI